MFKSVEQYRANGFNLSYLSEADEILIGLFGICETLTNRLYMYMHSKDNGYKLTDEELSMLKSDILKAKSEGMWNNLTEEKTIEKCTKRLETAKHIRKLSDADRKIYWDAISDGLFEL